MRCAFVTPLTKPLCSAIYGESGQRSGHLGNQQPKVKGHVLSSITHAQLAAIAAAVQGQLHAATARELEDRDFGFELLLPDAGASLFERSGALFDWCRGFVGAFGLAAGHAPKLSEEGEEALADLVRLAAAAPEEDGDEEDEQALAEIEEFVRVAALLLHGDCALGPRHRGRLN